MILVLVLNGCFLQQASANLSVMALVEQLKRYVAKRSFLWSLNSQILSYKAILYLCENELILIKFFGICKESMISVENREMEKRYEGGDTVPVTRSNQHLISLSSLRIGPKLTSEDESCVYIQSITLCDLCIQLILVTWHG